MDTLIDPAVLKVLIFLGGIGFSLLGWLSREMWGAVKEIKNDLIKLKDQLNEQFTRKDDFKSFKEDVMSVLRRIEDKLDGKADK